MDDLNNNMNTPIEFTSETISTDGINKSSAPSARRKSDYSSSDSSSDTEDYSDGDSISSVRRKKREISSSKSIDWKLTYDLSMKKIGAKNIFATLSNDVPNCLVKSVKVYVCPYNFQQANMFSEEINQSEDVSLKFDDFYIVLDFLTPKLAKKALCGIRQTIKINYDSLSVKRVEENNTSLICGFSENDLRCTDEIFDYIVDNLDCPPHKFEELYEEIKRRVYPERFPSTRHSVEENLWPIVCYNLSEINYKEKNLISGFEKHFRSKHNFRKVEISVLASKLAAGMIGFGNTADNTSVTDTADVSDETKIKTITETREIEKLFLFISIQFIDISRKRVLISEIERYLESKNIKSLVSDIDDNVKTFYFPIEDFTNTEDILHILSHDPEFYLDVAVEIYNHTSKRCQNIIKEELKKKEFSMLISSAEMLYNGLFDRRRCFDGSR